MAALLSGGLHGAPNLSKAAKTPDINEFLVNVASTRPPTPSAQPPPLFIKPHGIGKSRTIRAVPRRERPMPPRRRPSRRRRHRLEEEQPPQPKERSRRRSKIKALHRICPLEEISHRRRHPLLLQMNQELP
jgi:hypothetical protein